MLNHRLLYRSGGLLRIWLAAVLMLPAVILPQSGIEPSEIVRVGQSGWQFLKINGDPRQASLGGSMMVTSSPDANVVFGSPALLTMVPGINLQVNTMNWIADIRYNSFVYSQEFGRVGTFALSFVSLDYGDIAETIHLPLQGGGTVPYVTGETFTAADIAAGLSYARKVTDQLSLGGTVKYISETIAGTGMENWAVDFSTMYFTEFRTLRLSLAARNFGPDAHLVGYSEELQSEPVDIRMPLELRAGLAYDILEQDEDPHYLTVMAEGKVGSDGPEKIHLGTEYIFSNMFVLRAGYRVNYDEEGLTLGGGVNFTAGSNAYRVNFAYLDFGALTQVKMFSVGWLLNSSKNKRTDHEK